MKPLGLWMTSEAGLPCSLARRTLSGSVRCGCCQDPQGACVARLTVVLKPGCGQNCLDEVNSAVLYVSVGEPKKDGSGALLAQGALWAFFEP